VQCIHFISAAAEFELSSCLWVLINPDNVPVNENPLLLLLQWLHKLRQKTGNYQTKDRSALHCIPLGQHLFHAACTNITERNRPQQFRRTVDTVFTRT
jgi:hypothetical protein